MRIYEFSPPTMSAATTSAPKKAPAAMATEAPGSKSQEGALKGSSSSALTPEQASQQKAAQARMTPGQTINHPKFGPVKIKMDQGNKVVLATSAQFGQDVTVDKAELRQMIQPPGQ
jgi:hypothetical protein